MSLKWTGVEFGPTSVKDAVLLLLNGRPIVMKISGRPQRWVVLFSTPQKLEAIKTSREFMNVINDHVTRDMAVVCGTTVVPFNFDLKVVTDGVEFCESIWEQGLDIMLDPEPTDRGTTKFKWIVRSSEADKYREMS